MWLAERGRQSQGVDERVRGLALEKEAEEEEETGREREREREQVCQNAGEPFTARDDSTNLGCGMCLFFVRTVPFVLTDHLLDASDASTRDRPDLRPSLHAAIDAGR